MAKVETAPSSEMLTRAIEACVANGERLLEDTLMLEFEDPPASRLALSTLAQEELAKAFLLFLVRGRVVPWNSYVLRAMNDHACKHLVGTVMDYLCPRWDEPLEEMMARIKFEVSLGEMLPVAVADAISILRHEKIGRWESSAWSWAEPPKYDQSALRIAEGRRDRIKQDALYVSIGRDGRVLSTPMKVSKAASDAEYERGRGHLRLVSSLLSEEGHSSRDYEKIFGFFAALFEPAKPQVEGGNAA